MKPLCMGSVQTFLVSFSKILKTLWIFKKVRRTASIIVRDITHKITLTCLSGVFAAGF